MTEVRRSATAAASERIASLDALRAGALFLGVVLHSLMSVGTIPWVVTDDSRVPVADAIINGIHAVSYTHLDVYKRQVYLPCIFAARTRPSRPLRHEPDASNLRGIIPSGCPISTNGHDERQEADLVHLLIQVQLGPPKSLSLIHI